MKNIILEFKQDGAVFYSHYVSSTFPCVNSYEEIKTLLEGHLNALGSIEYFKFSWQDENNYTHIITNRKEEE